MAIYNIKWPCRHLPVADIKAHWHPPTDTPLSPNKQICHDPHCTDGETEMPCSVSSLSTNHQTRTSIIFHFECLCGVLTTLAFKAAYWLLHVWTLVSAAQSVRCAVSLSVTAREPFPTLVPKKPLRSHTCLSLTPPCFRGATCNSM